MDLDPIVAATTSAEAIEGLANGTAGIGMDGNGGLLAAIVSLTGAIWMIYRVVRSVRSEDKETSSNKKRGDALYERLVARLEHATEERDEAVSRADKFAEAMRSAQLAEATTNARLELLTDRFKLQLEQCKDLERRLQDITVEMQVRKRVEEEREKEES